MVSPLTVIATIVVLGVIAAGILATVVEFMVPDIHNRPNLWRSLEPPSLEHPMGTDPLGRDILIRIIFGTKPVLLVIVISVIVAATLGTIIGLTSGYFGGRVDLVMSRVIDALMSFPAILIALAIVAALGPGRAIGASPTRIIFRHILPNIAGPIIVQATFTAASAILWEAALSFLGLGAQPPTPSWGLMLYEAKDYMRTAPHAIVFPGLAIFVTVLSFNIVGEALRDMLDPRFRKVMR
jgi:peptide/nickel transport system permease protein